MRLKTDLHLHTGDDPLDYVAHSSEEMIDHAAKLGFDVMAITNHDFMSHSEELADYAASRGIVLVPGVEATIENRHVLLEAKEKSLPAVLDAIRQGQVEVHTDPLPMADVLLRSTSDSLRHHQG